MKLYAVKVRTVETGDSLVGLVLHSLKTRRLQLEDDDVLAISSKIVSFSEKRLVRLSQVKPSKKAEELAKQYSLRPELAELVLREADEICGGVEKAILTLKNGVLTANAGIDNKNAPADWAVLWPTDAMKSAKNIMEQIRHATCKKVAVVIVDSGLIPLRIGTTGLALAVAGFKPIKDSRGGKDIFGKPIVITRQAIADDLASAAHLLMGEAAERTPVVLIRDVPLDFDGKVYGSADMMMSFKECIFMNAIEEGLSAIRKVRA